jgi:hypothetical protein
MKADGYGVGGEPQHAGDLGRFELFPRPQVEELPVGIGEFGNGSVQFGVEGRVAGERRARLAFGSVDEAEVAAVSATVVGHMTSSDAVGPRQSGGGRDFVQPTPQRQHRLRHNVVDCSWIDASAHIALDRFVHLSSERLEALPGCAGVR